jgi:hypothetical protein
MTNDEAYEFVLAIAAGGLDDLAAIADRLADVAATAGS